MFGLEAAQQGLREMRPLPFGQRASLARWKPAWQFNRPSVDIGQVAWRGNSRDPVAKRQAACGYLRAFGPGRPLRLAAAQRAFIAAAILALVSGLIVRLPCFAGLLETTDAARELELPLDFAQRARCAAAILSRASGDMVRLPAFAGFALAADAKPGRRFGSFTSSSSEPNMLLSFCCSA
ncbi:MAG TPA: hypothetical protein VGO11_17740 [Chthoniobacteraceae bacterium]|nr:hypothetical protein [Chthoniobacteraceae bacterium]